MNTHRRPSPPSQKLTTTAIHIIALDGIVNVNSLFTLAVFLGLTWNPTDPNYTLIDTSSCAPNSYTAENFVAFHVYSFSSFLFSSLVASGLKQAIRTAQSPADDPVQSCGVADVNLKVLHAGILVSSIGSGFGCLFLMLALVNLVQIKLGSLDCWNMYTLAAVGPLVVLVPTALVIYICVVSHAFTR